MGPPPTILAPDTLRGVDDLVRANLEVLGELWFNRLLISTALVFVGLVLEFPEIWHDTVQAFRDIIHSCKPVKPLSPRLKLFGMVGWVLIVVGVGGEYVAETIVSRADGLVRKFDEILLADAQTRTSSANERASGLSQ
jgi:hypothetical protein